MEIWTGSRVDERGSVWRENDRSIVKSGGLVAWSSWSRENEERVILGLDSLEGSGQGCERSCLGWRSEGVI